MLRKPSLDWDDAESIGDEETVCYFGAVEAANGTWWAITDVGADHFTAGLLCESGYDTEKEAYAAAREAAIQWCEDNDVNWDPCANCSLPKTDHADGKCLFEPTEVA